MMALCPSEAVPNLLPTSRQQHHHHQRYRFSAVTPSPGSKTSVSFNRAPIPLTTYHGVFHRVVYSTKLLPRATTAEETSTETSMLEDVASEKNGGPKSESLADGQMHINEFEFFLNGGPKSESLSDVQMQINEFLEKLDIKLDSEDAYLILLYGSAAFVALWLASAVVGAIDSIPLFPKLMEVVGLGYTIWFSSRYLLFKKNRDELAAKIEELKQQVIGLSDD